MQVNADQKISAAGILDFLEESLAPARLKISVTIRKKITNFFPWSGSCPIYFTGCNDTTVVLPPASFAENTQMDSLEQLLSKISSMAVSSEELTQIKKKNIVIPVACTAQGSEFFVTLFYNVNSKKITVYKSSGLVDFTNIFLSKITEIFRNFGLEVVGVELHDLDCIYDSSYLAMYTAIALSNILVCFSIIDLQMHVDALFDDRYKPKELRMLRENFITESTLFQKNVNEKLRAVLRRIGKEETFLKELLMCREGINHNGSKIIKYSPIANDFIVRELNNLNSDSVKVTDENRIKNEAACLKGALSRSQLVIIVCVIAYILSEENIRLSQKDNVPLLYSNILINILQKQMRVFLVDAINGFIAKYPNIFKKDSKVEILEESFDDSIVDNPKKYFPAGNDCLPIFEFAVQMAMLALVLVVAVVISMYLSLDIGIIVGVSVGTISVYGLHTLFKDQPESRSCADLTEWLFSNKSR